jgi:uncharacterized repeat protein (TIGR01451 family)
VQSASLVVVLKAFNRRINVVLRLAAAAALLLRMESVPADAAQSTFSTPATSGSYTVPAGVTRIQIFARGADGGQASVTANGAGAGASITAVFNVVPGDIVRFVVGQKGFDGDYESGGGGGTGVFINTTLVMVTGGGGGEDNTGIGQGGRATTAGSAGLTAANGGTAGTSGGGGGGGNNGGVIAPVGDGGGGGGGISSAGGNVISVGPSLTTGGGQADTDVTDGLTVSAGGTSNQTSDPGGADGIGESGGAGFGGGGAGSHRESGAGGGYSGGGGGGSGGSPGGGGSYLNTVYAGYVSGTITAGADGGALGTSNNGSVVISYTTLQLRKISTGNIGSFSFSSPNMATSPTVITTTATGITFSSSVIPLVAFGTSTVITEALVTGFNATSIVCSGIGAGTATNNLAARTVTLNAAATAAGNDVVCTYTNNYPGPALLITKTPSTAGPVIVGQVITYTYVVTNSSNIVINNVSVADVHNGLGVAPVPGSEFLLSDAAPTGNSTDTVGGNSVWSVLAAGDAIRFTSTYTVTQNDIDFRQ